MIKILKKGLQSCHYSIYNKQFLSNFLFNQTFLQNFPSTIHSHRIFLLFLPNHLLSQLYNNSMIKHFLILVIIFVGVASDKNNTRLQNALNQLFTRNQYLGLTVHIAENASTIFSYNNGLRDFYRNLTINNQTVFRMASLAKSPTSVAILQLRQQNKLSLTDSIEKYLGFKVRNPKYPEEVITIQMILSHTSSLSLCDAYFNFLHITYIGPPWPQIKELLTPSGKYYGLCLFNDYKPGTYFEYTDYNFAIAATIVQIVSGVRFDLYMKTNVFDKLNLTSTTYKREDFIDLNRVNDIAVLYRTDDKGNWLAQADQWNGVIPPRNFDLYKLGTNGAVFSPMGGLYSTSGQLVKYIDMLRNQGTYNGVQILSKQSALQMVRPRFRFSGSNKAQHSYNAYGLGIRTTTYLQYDNIFPHEVVKGHQGDSYGLISEYSFTKNYSYSYVINGAKNGYHFEDRSFFEIQRQELHNAIYEYLYK